MSADAYLIAKDYEVDELGQFISEPEKREIPCEEKSLRGAEFHAAGRNGINAQIVLVTQAINYMGEELIEYNGVVYLIYRHFRNPISDEIELYLKEKCGNDEQENQG